jgi:hypothetical protein
MELSKLLPSLFLFETQTVSHTEDQPEDDSDYFSEDSEGDCANETYKVVRDETGSPKKLSRLPISNMRTNDGKVYKQL